MKQLLILILLLAAGRSAAQPPSLPEALTREVALLGETLSDGHAVFYPEYSSAIEVPGNDALHYRTGVAVLVSMGGWAGGNTNNQYLAVYAVDDRPEARKTYRLLGFAEVGGKGDRLFTGLSAEGQQIVLTGFDYAETDSPCCPSIPLQIGFVVDDRGGLVPEQP